MRDGIEPGQPALWAEGEGPSLPPAPRKSEPAPQPPARFQPINRQQMVLRRVDLERWREPDHLARATWETTGRLDDGLHDRGPGGGRAGGAFAYRSAPADRSVGLRLQREGEFGAGSGAARGRSSLIKGPNTIG
jgi:hypothetical protein